jgi:hypothetical protein
MAAGRGPVVVYYCSRVMSHSECGAAPLLGRGETVDHKQQWLLTTYRSIFGPGERLLHARASLEPC